MKENKFQSKLIKELRSDIPECIILKNDPTYIQGIPDLLVLYKDKWAALECKRNSDEIQASMKDKPTQHYYVDKMNNMAFASYICPENKQEVLDELFRTFGVKR